MIIAWISQRETKDVQPSASRPRKEWWVHDSRPGQAWVRALLGGAGPSGRVNNWLVLHEAVHSGAGLAVMPCYVGDGDHHLQRVGPILKDVAADQYLLVHRDLRELPRVRAVMDALIDLFHNERAALEGRRAGPRPHPHR